MPTRNFVRATSAVLLASLALGGMPAQVLGGGTGLRLIGGIARTRMEAPKGTHASDFIMRSSARSIARR
jgi:hypothetical protein